MRTLRNSKQRIWVPHALNQRIKTLKEIPNDYVNQSDPPNNISK